MSWRKKSPMFLFTVFRTANMFVTCFHEFQTYESTIFRDFFSVSNKVELFYWDQVSITIYFHKKDTLLLLKKTQKKKSQFRRFWIRENMLLTVDTSTIFWIIFGVCVPKYSKGNIKNWGDLFNLFSDAIVIAFRFGYIWSKILVCKIIHD